jgi:penicillin-binding protein 2
MQKRRIAIADVAFETLLFNRRAVIAFGFILLCFGILIANLYNLQVLRYEEYSTRADGNRIKLVPLSPNRGMIFDRRGTLLAENAPVHSVELVPEQVPDLAATVEQIAAIIEITPEQKTDFFKEVKAQRRFKSIALKELLTEQEVARLAVHLHKLKGVTLEARLTRHYPYGDLLTHGLGYIGKINDKEFKQIDENGQSANYAATRDIGKIGIEKFYETQLHGTVGFQEVEVNNRGRVIRTLREQPAISGDDLYLTLDLGLQLKAQEALGENRGAIVALDPRTGGILAFYSNPSYDPNLFVHGISGKNYRMLLNSPDRPLVNRMTQGVYPPASTVKPLMAVAGLEAGIVTESTRVPDPGFYRLPRVSRPWRDHIKWGHGYVDVYTGITKSCDTYFYDLAYKMGVDRISGFMQKAGYGHLSGIDIGEETSGLMPSREWKKVRRKQNWGPGDTINIGIGQGYWQSTPLQIALTTSTLINDGARITPRLGESFRNSSQQTSLLKPLEQVIEVVNPQNWAIAREAMYRTVLEGGTAHGAFIGATYTAGGKTGTAQVINIAAGVKYKASNINERHRDNALFVGYAPHDKPEIVISVIVENVASGGGGTNAAPVARQLMDYYFSDQYNNPVLPDRATVQKIQAERAAAMIAREQRYAEEAAREKAAKALAAEKANQHKAGAETPAPVSTENNTDNVPARGQPQNAAPVIETPEPEDLPAPQLDDEGQQQEGQQQNQQQSGNQPTGATSGGRR